MSEHEVVHCRIAPVTINGFPIVNVDETCQECDIGETVAPDLSDYINYKNDDGTVLTMHIPTVIGKLYYQVKTLEQELEYLKRER